MRSDIVPGAVFPDYELPDHEGAIRRLSSLQDDDPLILTLARGHYCPKEHQQHLQLAAFYPQIAVAYTQIATISTDDHHTSQEFRASVGAEWPFLSDPERLVQQDLDIQEYTDLEHDPMIPHTLVLKPGLVVHSIYSSPRSIRRSPSPTRRSSRSRPTTTTRARSSARRSGPSGPSSRTRSARCSRTSTSRSTPTRNTTR